VTIAEPANSSFTPMIITLNPNQIQQVDLTPYIGQIENRSYDIISNYGLKITATYPIMVEYEISSSYSSVYNLKGKSALGLEFYTPIPPTNQSTRSFEIVATENNSTIIITPYVNTSTHLAGIPFTIVLNQGQTYPLLLETIYWYGDGTNPIGCKIVANKLIAVNIENGDSADQLVPTNLIGNEYIVSTPSIEDGIQAMAGSVMIYAIRNNTQIFCNFYDSLSYVATIGEGRTFFTLNSLTKYIKTTEPVYIIHFTYNIANKSMALLSPIRCSGTNLASFSTTPITNLRNSVITIMTETGNHQNTFELNGNNINLNNYFLPVAGTNGQFMIAQIRMSDPNFNILIGNNILKNRYSKFMTGIITGKSRTFDDHYSYKYSYISDYKNEPSIISNKTVNSICIGDSLKIAVDSQRYASYKWRYPDGSERTNANLRIGNVTAAHAGQYIRTIDGNNCTIKSDTFNVQVHPKYLTQIELL
jgi:hypothetical protein